MVLVRFQRFQLLVWLGAATISSVLGQNNPVCRRKGTHQPLIKTGPSTFKELVEKSTLFVDKTLFIRDFLESVPQVTLITYPKRWGKSLIMDMLKSFLRIEVDETGQRAGVNAWNVNFFAKGQTEAGGDITMLNIAKHKYILDANLGKHPVIHISFDGIRHPTFGGSFDLIKDIIKKLFKEHSYLHKVWKKRIGKSKSSDEKNKIRDWVSKYKAYSSGSFVVSEAEDSLRFLSAMLKEHFDSDVFVLIDDYDQPLSGILTANPKPEKENEVKQLVEFMSNLMTRTYQDNTNLKKGLITGIVRMDRKSYFSGLDNLKEYTILNNNFFRYYGFTRYEVDALIKDFDITTSLSKQAKNWYTGYTIANDVNTDQYNPWDIVKFLESEEIENYWISAGPFPFAAQLFVRKIPTSPLMARLIRKEEVEVKLNGLSFTPEEMVKVKDMIAARFKIEKEDDDWLFLRMLYTLGYLSYDRNSPSDITRVRLANKEITHELSGE